MVKLILVMFVMFIVACNQQDPIQITVKMDTPRDTVIIEKVVRDTIIIGKLNKYEKKLIIAMRNKSDKGAYGIINQYKYDTFPYKCGGSVQVKRILSVDIRPLFKDSLLNGVFGYVVNDTLQCNKVENSIVTKTWEIYTNGNRDSVDVNKRKFTLGT